MCATRLHNFCINKGGADDIRTNLAGSTLAKPSNDCPISVDNYSVVATVVLAGLSEIRYDKRKSYYCEQLPLYYFR